MHKEWCGKSCADCEAPCCLDEQIACSPDCEFLGPDGEHEHPECQNCDALPLYRVPICYDGALYIRADSAEEARNIACCMSTSAMYSKADGTWDVDWPELTDNQNHI